MALRSFADLAHDDEQLYDLTRGMPEDYEPPAYPQGCRFSLPAGVLERAGATDGKPGDEMRFSAMAEVTSVFKSLDDGCRVELRLVMFAGEDGQFIPLDTDETMAPCICLCDGELEKLGLEADCERGDLIHLIGTARLESTSSTEYGGETASLQITSLTYEDESDESREG